MILIDYSQIFISSIMKQIGKNYDDEINLNDIRCTVLSNILYYKTRFERDYGKIVLCSDGRQYWRKDIFPYYKGKRKENREKSAYDWKTIFKYMSQIKKELKETFPYKLVESKRAEADDVVGVLCEYSQNNELEDSVLFSGIPQKVLIISSDKDFMQLQKFKNVSQYTPLQKRFIRTNEPEKFLKEHIIKGDSADGIPNFLSEDNIFFIDGKRQKSIMSKKLERWVKFKKPEDFCDETMLINYRRNQRLIDMSYIPEDVKKDIINEYEKPVTKKSLLDYFMKYKLKVLSQDIQNFY